MANFCLIPSEVDKFKNALIDGTIDPAKLAKMTSEERRAVFEKVTGKGNAEPVNALFESKLLLKNQQRGMITWAKTVAGMKPEVRRDMLTRIQRLEHVLDPAEHEQFLEDLAAQKLGAHVTESEARTIAELSRRIDESKTAMDAGGDRLKYGRAVVAMEDYVGKLKLRASSRGIVSYLKRPDEAIVALAGQSKAINASMDNSAIFRQGWKTLLTNPIIWQRNARKTFGYMVKEFGNKPVMDEIRADLISRPNAVNGYYQKMGLDIGKLLEEPFPTHLPGKIPVLGRLYRASESAYTGFVFRQRADIADKFLEIAKKSSITDLNDAKELRSIGKMVNSMTGRGNLGRAEPIAGIVNNVFFSPRFIKSNIDFLVTHPLGGAGGSKFVRYHAAANLVKVISGTAAILAIADAVRPGSVDWNPTSADFGKIKIGNTRFDVAGGMDSVVTLAARMIPHPGPEGWGLYSKSSVTGQTSKINSGKYGSLTGDQVFWNFFENKLSPMAGIMRDFELRGRTPQGTKPTIGGEALGLITPLSAKNRVELAKDPHSANDLLATIADGLGLVTNTYGRSTTDWNNNTTKELTQFRAKVGNDKFKQANQTYNQRLDDYIQKLVSNPKYKSMSQDDQQATITDAKNKIRTQVLKEQGFKYKRAKPNKAATATKKSLMPGVLR